MTEWKSTTSDRMAAPPVKEEASIAGLRAVVEAVAPSYATAHVEGIVAGLRCFAHGMGLLNLDDAKLWAEATAHTLAAAGWTGRP